MAYIFVYSYSLVVVCAKMKAYRHQWIPPTFSAGLRSISFFSCGGCRQTAMMMRTQRGRVALQCVSTAADALHATRHAEHRLNATRRWLDDIVIGKGLCPFAAAVRRPPKLRMRASDCISHDNVVRELAEEADMLRAGINSPDATAETALLVLDATVGGNHLSWRDLVSLSWRLQEEAIVNAGHAEHLQIVLFHPLATHSTYADPNAPTDAGDYSIRAPHPTVQILREVDVLKAVRDHADAAGIPARNRVRLRAAGVQACVKQLAATLE